MSRGINEAYEFILSSSDPTKKPGIPTQSFKDRGSGYNESACSSQDPEQVSDGRIFQGGGQREVGLNPRLASRVAVIPAKGGDLGSTLRILGCVERGPIPFVNIVVRRLDVDPVNQPSTSGLRRYSGVGGRPHCHPYHRVLTPLDPKLFDGRSVYISSSSPGIPPLLKHVLFSDQTRSASTSPPQYRLIHFLVNTNRLDKCLVTIPSPPYSTANAI